MINPLHYTYRAGLNSQAPLALLVHGRAGNVSVMSTFSRSLPADWGLLFVQAPLTDDIGGYSWWDILNLEGKNQQQETSLGLLASFYDDFLESNQLTPQFAVAIGFSQGAAMISLLAQSNPSMFKALALLSGFIIKRQVTFSAEKPTVLVIHGTLDEIVPLSKVNEGIEHLRSLNFQVTLHTEEVGHKIGIQGMRLLKEWAASL